MAEIVFVAKRGSGLTWQEVQSKTKWITVLINGKPAHEYLDKLEAIVAKLPRTEDGSLYERYIGMGETRLVDPLVIDPDGAQAEGGGG